ncbi:tetratricopeptide repeat protein [candidate division NPL-UPA2 bacterium]|nr:tetratricopeptide repeat protein [candidate division NPL-UPA2 bacterium]
MERVQQPKPPGPSLPVPKEVKPPKRVLTERELEEIRKRREESEANSWLQLAGNFANAGMYTDAIEYYRKVINKYPESEQAKKAGQRIEEIKSKLE